jgi:hypothetical protein
MRIGHHSSCNTDGNIDRPIPVISSRTDFLLQLASNRRSTLSYSCWTFDGWNTGCFSSCHQHTNIIRTLVGIGAFHVTKFGRDTIVQHNSVATQNFSTGCHDGPSHSCIVSLGHGNGSNVTFSGGKILSNSFNKKVHGGNGRRHADQLLFGVFGIQLRIWWGRERGKGGAHFAMKFWWSFFKIWFSIFSCTYLVSTGN